MSPDAGLLRRCSRRPTDVEEGESVRGGEDNNEVLTEYTGTVPGDVVAERHPDRRRATSTRRTRSPTTASCARPTLTGVFYPDTEPMTYTVDFDDYGTEKDITAP